MTLPTLCALTPPLCRMAADPAVRAGICCLAEQGDAHALCQAMSRYPDDAAAVLSLLGGGSLTPHTLRRRFHPEALAFFHLCGQCSPTELLTVLTRCTAPPTADGLALLISDHRREAAMLQYSLQILWRILGDPALPDPLMLFPQATHTPPAARDVLRDLTTRLKEADS